MSDYFWESYYAQPPLPKLPEKVGFLLFDFKYVGSGKYSFTFHRNVDRICHGVNGVIPGL
jgi:hypothetical protein